MLIGQPAEEVLQGAAAMLRGRIPELEVRIVGDGPCAAELRRQGGGVTWLGDISRGQLAQAFHEGGVDRLARSTGHARALAVVCQRV